MPNSDELFNLFLDLPADPEEAFVVFLHWQMEELEKNVSPNSWNAEREFVDNMIAFDQVYNTLAYKDFEYPPNLENEFIEYYNPFLRYSKKLFMKFRLEHARRAKVTPDNLVVLDSASKLAIRQLVEAIKQKLEETNIPEDKRRNLFAKLNAFLNEVDQNLTRTAAFFDFVVQATRAANEAGAEFKPLTERIDRVLDMIDKAKKWVDSLPSWTERKKLPPPPKQLEGPSETSDVKNDSIAPF